MSLVSKHVANGRDEVGKMCNGPVGQDLVGTREPWRCTKQGSDEVRLMISNSLRPTGSIFSLTSDLKRSEVGEIWRAHRSGELFVFFPGCFFSL